MSSADATAGLSISGALARLGCDVRDLQAGLRGALGGSTNNPPRSQAPDTLTQAYSDAQAAQQTAAEQGGAKKRKVVDEAAEAAKKWARGPGDSLVDADVAPFLAYNEEFFRHINLADVGDLMPEGSIRTPEDDPDFRIPTLGRYYVLGEPHRDPHTATPPPLAWDHAPPPSLLSLHFSRISPHFLSFLTKIEIPL
jgi:bromodomain and PHD finger-containing protein 1